MTKDIAYDQRQNIEGQAFLESQEDISSNQSGNRPFNEIVKTHLSRRSVVKNGLSAFAAGFIAPQAIAGSFGNKNSYSKKDAEKTRSKGLVEFKPLTIAEAARDNSVPSIASDYEYQVLIPWGTPIEPGVTDTYEGDPKIRPTPEQAAKQVGIGHDGMWFFPADRENYRFACDGFVLDCNSGMLCINHEFGHNSHVLGKKAPQSLQDVRLSQNVHGVSVVAIQNHVKKGWEVVSSENSRRITVNTPVEFSGPAAGSDLLKAPNDNKPVGTLNNCGSGSTPWGTYLTCEENFNGYFGTNFVADKNTSVEEANESFYASISDSKRAENLSRYGFSVTGFGYNWQLFDKRFDLEDVESVNEPNRFGWIVEIDPFDATQKPIKRTALGRFKHEAVAITEAPNGRIAAYMGDDQRFDYCYKFVSDLPWKKAVSKGESPLDKGTLYAAQFNDDGNGRWLALSIDNPLLAERFGNQAELLINTRIAADILGATPMDRPEWTTIGKDSEVYWTLTNNSRRKEVDAANPEAPNNDGHIIKMTGDHLAAEFDWEILLLSSTTRDTEGVFTDPDAAWADSEGRLFIGTDGNQPDGLANQLVVIDTTRAIPEAKRLLTGVTDDEITGFTVTPDYRTAFINIQHPGNGDPSITNFPAPKDGVTIPRDCTLVIRRKDGGVIGS